MQTDQIGATSASTPPPLGLADVNDRVNHEPRIRDLDLAERLGFDRPRNVRKLIERNLIELQSYAEVCSTVEQTSDKGGRPGREFWLTEGQALVVCALSRTPRAAAVRKLVIEVFMIWRAERGRPAAAPPLPLPEPAVTVEHSLALHPTADPGVVRVEARLPLQVTFDLVSAFTQYQTTIATGLRRPAH